MLGHCLEDESLSISHERLVRYPASHQKKPGVAVDGFVIDGGETIEYAVKVLSRSSRIFSLSVISVDPSALRRGDDPEVVGP